MRDLLITLIVIASLPYIVRQPVSGILMWVWISVMNPHTQGWGYATTFPFALIVAIATLFSLAIHPMPKLPPLNDISILLLLFIAWMNVTTLFAMYPTAAQAQWLKVMKIMLMSVATLSIIRRSVDIHKLMGVLCLSLGFYGAKGGIFTLRGGGVDRVWGPEGTFIGDNNAIALALIMALPLMRYLQLRAAQRWLRYGIGLVMLLSALAALASYSRGGLLAFAAMLAYLWLRSGRKLAATTLIMLIAPATLLFMPASWSERMDSISHYQQDESAMGRINAWRMAWNLARDRYTGGGFEIAEPPTFALYAPNPADVHAAHSIYFQALGEHGFVGLLLYLLLLLATWRAARDIVQCCAARPELLWARQLAILIQASLIGFMVGGAFLSLLYFDVPYYLMALIVATRNVVQQAKP